MKLKDLSRYFLTTGYPNDEITLYATKKNGEKIKLSGYMTSERQQEHREFGEEPAQGFVTIELFEEN